MTVDEDAGEAEVCVEITNALENPLQAEFATSDEPGGATGKYSAC